MHSITAMNRREAVRRIALLMGAAMVGSRLILSGQTMADKTAAPFTGDEKAYLDEIAETILPATDIPGAKAAGVGAFMAMMVDDCYSDKEQAAFRDGMANVNDACTAKCGKAFLAATPAERTAVLNEIDAERRTGKNAHYFGMFRDLTLLGYFSSEIGCTKAVRYVEVPGAFHGDIPYKKGDPAWFS
ncbi:MAG TPA: gluconate 2-dehydrogenase subunit 3 family protein [Opitutaceae bacterium]